MGTFHSTPRLGFAAGIIAIALAVPGAEARTAERGPMGNLPAFETLDADGDGRITRDEIASFIEARRADWQAAGAERRAARLDDLVSDLMENAEGGTLDEDTLRSGLADWMEARRAERVERLHQRMGPDARRRTADAPRARPDQGQGAHQGRGHGRMAPSEAMLDRIDADGDGAISREEFDAAMERMGARGDRRGEQRGDQRGRQR